MSNDQGEVVGEGMQLHPIKHHGFRGQWRDEDRLLIHPPRWDSGDVIGTIQAQLKLLHLLELNPLSDGKSVLLKRPMLPHPCAAHRTIKNSRGADGLSFCLDSKTLLSTGNKSAEHLLKVTHGWALHTVRPPFS